MAKVRIEGLDKLERKFKKLDKEVAGALLLSAVDAGAEILEEGMRSLAPIDTGKGAGQITRETVKATRTRAEVDVGPGKSGYYLTFHETGTIDMIANPFMRPALDALEGDIVDEIREQLESRVLVVARGA